MTGIPQCNMGSRGLPPPPPSPGKYFENLDLLRWEGTNTGLDYWTDIFLVFTHVVVIFHWLGN